MSYIDVHFHLGYKEYGGDDELINRCKKVGVEKLIASGFDLPSSEYAAEISARRDGLYFCAGFHPTEISKYKEGDLDKIASLAREDKCVAIGEIGLDYHYPDTDKIRQKELFIRQLLLADELALPVVVHSRDAAEDTLNILKDNSRLLKHGFLLHCFSYSPEICGEFFKIGGYFSFGGSCTYSGSKRARRSILTLPAGRVLTETDSPYMPPRSRQGQFPNTPESIIEICGEIAALRGESEEEFSKSVWSGAHELFKKLKPA